MGKTDQPQTRRERLACFFSMDGGYRWFLLVPVGALCLAILLLAFPARLMIKAESCTAQAQPATGNTYFVPYRFRCPRGGGYINPKTDHFIDFAIDVTFGLVGIIVLTSLVGAAARRIFGDPRSGPDLRLGFRPEDEA